MVWRVAGMRPTIRSTAGRKPTSSILDLVEDEHGDGVEAHQAAREEILKPAGGGDDDVGALGGAALGLDAVTDDDGGDAHAARAADGGELGGDLHRELAGGESGRAPRRRARWCRSARRAGCRGQDVAEPVGDCATRPGPPGLGKDALLDREGLGEPRATRASATACDTPRA